MVNLVRYSFRLLLTNIDKLFFASDRTSDRKDAKNIDFKDPYLYEQIYKPLPYRDSNHDPVYEKRISDFIECLGEKTKSSN